MYNAASWVDSTLESIAAQTYTQWELIAVDDGSSDDSASRVAAFAARTKNDVKIITIENQGTATARNVGIRAAESPFIALIDADDQWHPRKLESQLILLREHPEAVGCICDYIIKYDEDDSITRLGRFRWTDRALHDWALLEGSSPLLGSTLILRRDRLTPSELFREGMGNAEDLDFAFRLNSIGTILTTAQFHMTYRRHSGQNHRNFASLAPAYRDFTNRWWSTSPALYRRGQANAHILDAWGARMDGQFHKAFKQVLCSLHQAPLQWLRLVRGALRRRRSLTG